MFRNRETLGPVLPAFFVVACSSEPAAPPPIVGDDQTVDDTNSGDGDGDGDGVGDGDGDGDGAGDGDGDGDGSGDGDGDGDGDSALNCNQLDPDRVYLRGTLYEGWGGLAAVVLPESPTDSCVGFGGTTSASIIRNTDQRLAWVEGIPENQIHVFVADELTWTNKWEYPEEWGDNDIIVPTQDCENLWYPLIADPTTGELIYRCNFQWTRESGEVIDVAYGSHLLAVFPSGHVLVELGSGTANALRLYDSEDLELPLEIPDGWEYADILAVRHTPDGLWIAVGEDDVHQRWLLTGSQLTVEADYSDDPVPTSTCVESHAIDAIGDLFQICLLDDGFLKDGIIRRSPKPAQSELVYTEVGAPEDGWPYSEDDPWVFIHISHLVTGPGVIEADG